MRQIFDALSLDYGAHTAAPEHVANGDCGCGAIDKTPEIIKNASVFASEIKETFAALDEDSEGLEDILNNYAAFAESTRDKAYSGERVMKGIANDGKVIKRLGGKHIEGRIVLNRVRDYTVDQQYVRRASDGAVDVFAVDIWRMQDIAEGLHPGDAAAQHRAFQSMLVFSLAVAATLTCGDLPVYVISESQDDAQNALDNPAVQNAA